MSILVSEAKKRIASAIGTQAMLNATDQELLAAINGAIEDGAEGMPYVVAPDTSVSLVTDTYEYDISGIGMDLIYCVTMADSEGNYDVGSIIGRHLWWVVHGTTPYLKFNEGLWTPTNGRTIRIEGQKFQDVVSADTDTIYMYAPFVVRMAAATLLGNVGSDREQLMLMMAEDARQRGPQRPRPNARRV